MSRSTTTSRRVRPDDDRVELGLIPDNVPVGIFRTDAEIRVFVEDAMVLKTQKDFANLNLIEDDLRGLAADAYKTLQVELDVNIERLGGINSEFDAKTLKNPAFIRERILLLGFKFDTFLRSLKVMEAAEDRKDRLLAKREELEGLVVAKIKSEAKTISRGEYGELPANLVEHMLMVGMEKHLQLIREAVWGEIEPYGITVTFKDLCITRTIEERVGGDHADFENEPRGPTKLAHRMEHVFRPSGPTTVWSTITKGTCLPCYSLSDRISGAKQTKEVKVLKNLSGIIRPGRATLLLGAPHSGKTQLIRALSGRSTIGISGDVFYNHHASKNVHATNFCTVVEENDVHIPNLTVRETLQFAFACRGGIYVKLAETPEAKAKAQLLANNRVDLIMATLGLTRVADTVIGDANLKGISGGEAHRVTLGEMLIVGAKVLFLDSISNGLDSAATFDITKSIRSLCRVFNVNAVVALLQPPPESFELFDDVILMSRGHIVYHGPRAEIESYFTSTLNIPRDPNMDVADFLIAKSNRRVDELAGKYRESKHFYNPGLLPAPEDDFLLGVKGNKMFDDFLIGQSKFNKSWFALFKVVLNRQFTLMSRNRTFIAARIAQNIIMGLLLGGMFFNIPFVQYYLVAMVLLQVCSMSAFATMGLISSTVAARNVLYKQNRERFFPISAYVASEYVVGLPSSILDALVLGSLMYFMCGLSLSSNGQPYFVFLTLFVTFSVCMACAVRFFAFVSPNASAAFGLTVFFMIVSMVFSGGIATPNVIEAAPWFVWLYWLSPFAWVYRSLLQNEYLSDFYQQSCAYGCPNNLQGQCVQYCTLAVCPQPYPAVTCGIYFLNARFVETDSYFLWLGEGVLLAYTLLFVGLSILVLKFVRWDGSSTFNPSTLPVDAVLKDVEADDDGGEGHGDGGLNESITSPNINSTSLPFTPLGLSWRNLVYTIDLESKEKIEDGRPGFLDNQKYQIVHVDLLKNISGFSKPFELTALMGSSGAGKSTLLDCLSFRKTTGRINAKIALGSQIVDPLSFRKQVGYVEQFGIHSDTATVRESLEFSALLRLPASVTPAERKAEIDKVLDVLEMRPIENSLVGTLDQGLSFEEVKRLTIAVELVAKPAVLFADEPTTGLTSNEAAITMRALSRVAKSGRPVICTIHQPSTAVFQLFDRLLLLKRGGEVVYFGKLGPKSKTLVDYFESIPGVDPLPEGLNPATWMLQIIGAGVGGRADKAETNFVEIYLASDLFQENENELAAILNSDGRRDSFSEGIESPSNGTDPGANLLNRAREESLGEDDFLASSKKRYNRDFRTQFRALMGRNAVIYWRSPSYSLLRWVITLFFSFLVSLLYLFQPLNSASSVQSRVGVMNLMCLLTANYNSATIIPFVFQKRSLFYREKSSGMISPTVYALASQLIEEPYILIEVVLSTIPFFFLIGFVSSNGLFFYYLFLMFFFVLFATHNGAMWAAAFSSQAPASLVSTLVTQLIVLFSGLSVPGSLLPTPLLFLLYLSPARWVLSGLVSSQMDPLTEVMCNPSGTVITWLNNTTPATPCPLATNQTVAVSYYLPDAALNACCDPPSNRPISVRNYVLYGFTYEDGLLTEPWLGGPHGYSVTDKGYAYLFVICAMIIVRVIGVVLTAKVNHQKR